MSIKGYTVIEFYGKGDPFFGGAADDRPLGKSGQFLTRPYTRDAIAEFTTKDDAEKAVAAANLRKGGLVGYIPIRDWSK
jgi:hypothetical protein